MKAVVSTAPGLKLANVDKPTPTGRQILVKVRASSLNRADLFMVEGRAHGAHSGAGLVLGLEWSGEVVELGPEANGFAVGDRVLCSGIGGFAEYAVCDCRRALPFPVESMSFAEAACLSVALRTSFVSINDLGALERGQSVLVLGASSGVGLMCLQAAKLLGAGLVIGTSTNAARREQLSEFGADEALDSAQPDWSERALALTHGAGVDLLIDFLAGPLIDDAMRATRIGGRIVNVGRMAGEQGRMDFDLHSLRRIQYFGQTFRTRSVEEIAEIDIRMREAYWPALAAGGLRLPIDRTLPLDRAAEAFELMKSNAHFGKIVLTM